MKSPDSVKNWKYLTQVYLQNKLPSSLLLWGQKGLELEDFTEQFSAWLLCDEREKNDYACAQCTSCQWLKAGTHPDLLMITPEAGNRLIKVDAVREIHAFSEKKSHRGGCRVILISPAEAMNVSAANALLKILEEPFENTFFLLVSYHVSLLLPTILSRCQKVYFSPPEREAFLDSIKNEKVEHLMIKWLAKEMSPLEVVEQIKALEKESGLALKEIVDSLLVWFYCQVIDSSQAIHGLYKTYDKLLQIKQHMQKGAPINEVLWLEEAFFTIEGEDYAR